MKNRRKPRRVDCRTSISSMPPRRLRGLGRCFRPGPTQRQSPGLAVRPGARRLRAVECTSRRRRPSFERELRTSLMTSTRVSDRGGHRGVQDLRQETWRRLTESCRPNQNLICRDSEHLILAARTRLRTQQTVRARRSAESPVTEIRRADRILPDPQTGSANRSAPRVTLAACSVMALQGSVIEEVASSMWTPRILGQRRSPSSAHDCRRGGEPSQPGTRCRRRHPPGRRSSDLLGRSAGTTQIPLRSGQRCSCTRRRTCIVVAPRPARLAAIRAKAAGPEFCRSALQHSATSGKAQLEFTHDHGGKFGKVT